MADIVELTPEGLRSAGLRSGSVGEVLATNAAAACSDAGVVAFDAALGSVRARQARRLAGLADVMGSAANLFEAADDGMAPGRIRDV